MGIEENNELVGVIGIQEVKDVTLIRHAYVCSHGYTKSGHKRKIAIPSMGQTNKLVLIGAWAELGWLFVFYEKHGFLSVSFENKDKLFKEVLVYSGTPDLDLGGSCKSEMV